MKPKPPDVVYVVTATDPKAKKPPSSLGTERGRSLPPPPPKAPEGKRQKVEKLPAVWEAIHAGSRASLLRTEGRALLALRKTVIGIVGGLAREVDGFKGAPEARKAQTLAAIKRTATQISSAVEHQVFVARGLARDAGAARLKAEIEQLHKDLAKIGFDPAKLPKLPKRTEGHDDAAFAQSVAHSFASSWSKSALSRTLEWEKRPANSLSAAIDRTVNLTDGRLRRIARTEVRQAYNAEHTNATNRLLEPGAPWRRFVGRRWEAKLDRTCDRCFAHHGEVVPLGKPFSGGDEPANMHPHCRCIDTIVFLPPIEAG